MSNSLVDKKDNKFIKKSNVIVRAVTNESAGIMTQRLFNFAILNTKNNNIKNIDHIGFWLKDFCSNRKRTKSRKLSRKRISRPIGALRK